MSDQTSSTTGERLVAVETEVKGVTKLIEKQFSHMSELQARNYGELREDIKHTRAAVAQLNDTWAPLLERKVDRSELVARQKEADERMVTVSARIDGKADKVELDNVKADVTELRTDLKKAVWTVLTPLLVALVAVAGVGGTLTYFNQRHAPPAQVQQPRVPPATPPVI